MILCDFSHSVTFRIYRAFSQFLCVYVEVMLPLCVDAFMVKFSGLEEISISMGMTHTPDAVILRESEKYVGSRVDIWSSPVLVIPSRNPVSSLFIS